MRDITLWYTRDDDGVRTLWINEPYKDNGNWYAKDCRSSDDIIGSDFDHEFEVINLLLGVGYHRLKRGGKMKIKMSIDWCASADCE